MSVHRLESWDSGAGTAPSKKMTGIQAEPSLRMFEEMSEMGDRFIRPLAARIARSASLSLMVLSPGSVWAQDTGASMPPPGHSGQPAPWQIGLQGPASQLMEHVRGFHNGLLLPIITTIVIFVLALVLYVILRFNKRANPVPSKVTHNTGIEVAWTVIPILILVVIAIPSFRVHYEELSIPKADLTLKVTGARFSWSYEYPDHGGIALNGVQMVEQENLKPGQPRLLTADTEVVVPVNKVVRVQVTSADVIHSFALPAFILKVDAVPGRLNEAWFRAEREGIYYGQCSELCGQKHAFMPIMIRVTSEDEFDSWVAAQKTAMRDAKPSAVLANAASLQN